MVAWALSLWAVYHYLRGRFLLSPVLLGVACWMQALVGLHVAILLIAIRLYTLVRKEPGPHTIGGVLLFGGLFVLWAFPALGPLIYQQLFEGGEGLGMGIEAAAHDLEVSLFYILAEFRLPHHYLPGSFYLHSYVRFGLLAIAAGGALLSPRFRRGLDDLSFIGRSLVIIALLCLTGTVFTEVFPVLTIAKLQFFKMTVLAKLFFIILIMGAVFFWMPQAIRAVLDAVMKFPRVGLAVVAAAWIGVGAATVLDDGVLRDLIGPFRRAEEPVGQVEQWARRNTSSAAIFAVPPSYSSFRSEAKRTIVINHKAIPYDDEEMLTWFKRLTDMAPIELPERGSSQMISDLDSAYASLDVDDLRRLASSYRFEYVIRPAPLALGYDTSTSTVQPADTTAGDGSDPLAAEVAADVMPEQEGSDAPADSLDVSTFEAAVPSRFQEVFRADGLYIYRLVTPALEQDVSE